MASIQRSPGYLRINHPETGEALTFVPGERLPEWVAETLDDELSMARDDRVSYHERTNVWTVADEAPAKKAATGRNAGGRS